MSGANGAAAHDDAYPSEHTPVVGPAKYRRSAKIAFLSICRALGMFAIARHFTRKRLRILCYHGFSIGDQHEYEPILFMRTEVFKRRMETLRRLRFPVITLDKGMQLLKQDSVDAAQVVITIDDGWKTTITRAAPILRDYGFPSCVYVTTYYSERQVPVFNVVIWYMLWRTQLTSVELSGIDPQLDGRYELTNNFSAVGTRWISVLERNFDHAQRQALLPKLAAALGLDFNKVLEDDRFTLMDQKEIVALADYGMDVQLHTHRHRLPQGSAELMRGEIEENRRVLQQWTQRPCVHFCYPSGVYIKDHPQWLAEAGIESATTCDGGLNDASTSPLLLKRYLDRDDWSDVEFEAAVTGFTDFCYWLRQGLSGRRSVPLSSKAPDAA